MVFPGTINSINNQGGAIFVLDGRNIGEDMNNLNFINPRDVETINVSTSVTDIQRYTGLNSVGVVEITTKSGEFVEKEKEVAQTFESPNYEEGSDDWKTSDDLRTTIFWEGFKIVNGNDAGYRFYHSDIISNFNIVIEGVSENGEIIYESVSYNAL